MEKKWIVYTIDFEGKVMYVGVTSNWYVRKSIHRTKRGMSSSAIPTDVDLELIEFKIISEHETKDEALRIEDALINEYNTINNGWNKNRSGYISRDTEWVKQLSKKSRIKNKDKRNERQRKHYHEHIEEYREYNRKYYHTNRDKELECTKEWFRNNKDKWNEYQREYRRKKKAQ